MKQYSSSRIRGRCLAFGVSLGALAPVTAEAQGEPVLFGVLEAGTGLEGADSGFGQILWQRARTRLEFGAEWSSTEASQHTLGLYAMTELEKTGSFGVEFLYRRWLDWGLGGFLGPTLVWRPKSLLGLHGGLSYRLNLGPSMAVVGDIGLAAFPVGTDRPQPEAIVLWNTIDIGLRLGF